MRLSTIFSILLFLSALHFSVPDSSTQNGICETFISVNGFQCHEFVVQTEDLYLLTLQRISSSHLLNINEAKPVFLYHGIMQGGEIWLLNEPAESLGFILADAGYDVWIGNTRSSSFSRGHLTLSSSDQDFWDWNFDDIVEKDVASMLNFISVETGKCLLYVGFSQGAMAGFSAFTDGKLGMLVEKAVMLSPIAFLSNIKSVVAKIAATFFLDQLDLFLGATRFSLHDETVNRILRMICDSTQADCYRNFLSTIEGPSCCMNASRIAYYSMYENQSTSMKNMVQLAQLVRSGRFCKYDRGILGNLIHYFRIRPPSYELGNLPKTLPFLLAYGGSDYLGDEEDVWRVATRIPGTVEMLYLPNYSHTDFVLGTSAYIDVYPRVLNFLTT